MDDLKGRQELYNGFGDTFTRGMEMVLTPLFLGAIGYGLDRVLGLLPVLTIILSLVGVVGVGVKEYYTYKAAMDAHQVGAPWAARGPSSGNAHGSGHAAAPRQAAQRKASR